jgi:hypothetical protein
MKKILSLLSISIIITGLSYGQIFITEIADPNDDNTSRYVELFNAGPNAVDLSTGYGLQRYTNGNPDPQATVYMLTGTIPANGFFIIARTASSFVSSYGFDPDMELGPDGPADSNGDDQIQLLDPSLAVIDIFGVPGEDGTGTCHEFEDGRAERNASVTSGNGGTWNEANWNVWADSDITGCTNHIFQPVNVGDGIFDPGQWIGYVPTSTIVSFTAVSSSISEDGTSIDVCVEITNPDPTIATTVEIGFNVESTAINGVDFATISFPYLITFPAGSSADQCLGISIIDDGDPELDETIILNLQNPSGGSSATLGTQIQHTLTIDDDDLICPNVGDLIFSEIMQNPAVVADSDGEWFEIYNTSPSAIDLFGIEIIDDSYPDEGFAIPVSIIIPPDGYAVFATNDNTATNGGLTPDYAYDYANLTLGNGTDGLTIQCNGTVIDIVIWDGGTTFPDPSGASMSLNIDFLNADDNDVGENWDTAVFPYGNGDLGTPGCSNDAACCELVIGNSIAVCDDFTPGVDTYTVSIDFTNGATSTYEINTTEGTVGGDNPSGSTSGTIVITDVNEGTDITVTIDNSGTGGSCNFILNITSPVCVPVSTAVEGDIIITEILQNPLNPIEDLDGEYFEVFNTTNSDIDMIAWVLRDNNTNYHVINSSLVVPANGFAVLGTNADMGTNGGVAVDYDYGDDLALANASDAIIIESNGDVEIDRVEWDDGATFPDPNGASMNLDPVHFSYVDNNEGINWCESTTVMGTQFGTPGTTNTTCTPCILELGDVSANCDSTTIETDTYTASIDFTGGGTSVYVITASTGNVGGDDPTSTESGSILITGVDEGIDLEIIIDDSDVGGTCNFTVNIESPVCVPINCSGVGSVIFTEIMQNPNAVSDDMGEWFELYNTTTSDIDLQGWAIIDDNHTLAEEGFTFPDPLIIPAEGYLLLANNGDAATNGGLPTPDFVYANGFPFLGNGNDGITIQCSDEIIDIVIWDDGETFPDPTGASMSLMIDHLNAVDNDEGTNWEMVSFTYGDGDFGTPGGPNDEPVSVKENEFEKLLVYPNPVENGTVIIRTAEPTEKTIELFDILGQKVFSTMMNGKSTEFNFRQFDKGIYLLKVSDSNKTETRKLVIE